MIFLLKLPSRLILVHKGTTDPIIFDTKEDAQAWLDNNEHPEDDFEMAECESRDIVYEYIKKQSGGGNG